ncbi:hypothetical protein ACFYY2_31145 [Streptomyces sp. NPDC001822]|uniref:hypothetical protein n=1 Tax=Streptomyces sp. NPDC001822 TaxID=3364614 RepID=UPI0036BE49D3
MAAALDKAGRDHPRLAGGGPNHRRHLLEGCQWDGFDPDVIRSECGRQHQARNAALGALARGKAGVVLDVLWSASSLPAQLGGARLHLDGPLLGLSCCQGLWAR